MYKNELNVKCKYTVKLRLKFLKWNTCIYCYYCRYWIYNKVL